MSHKLFGKTADETTGTGKVVRFTSPSQCDLKIQSHQSSVEVLNVMSALLLYMGFAGMNTSTLNACVNTTRLPNRLQRRWDGGDVPVQEYSSTLMKPGRQSQRWLPGRLTHAVFDWQ